MRLLTRILVLTAAASALVAPLPATARAQWDRCRPEPGRRAAMIGGTVVRGWPLEAPMGDRWILRLLPHDEGWRIQVAERGRETENLARLTPPWHFVPNPTDLAGWHFRNASNTGPNDGTTNAPQELRSFVFSPEVGRTIEYNGSATTEADVARVEAFGRGWLHVDEYRLTPPRRGERAAFEWLRFTACLTWPASR